MKNVRQKLAGFTLLAALLTAAVVEAQSITIDFGGGTPETINANAAQLAAIQRLTVAENASRAAQKPPLPEITAERFIRNILIDRVQNMINDAKSHNVADACANYAAAAANVRNQIDAALGGKSPCR